MIKHNLPPGDYVGISKAGTTVAVVITEGGFWAHEFRSKLQVELDDIASIMPARPEARLAEPETPTLCAKCNDHIIADDGAVCEICAETMDTIITELQTRIAELEAALDKAAHEMYEETGSCPSDMFDWEHPNTCIRECAKYEKPDEAWKCWRLWLMHPAPPEEQ